MKINPENDFILVEPIERKLGGGIILPDTVTKEKPEIGRVVAVGEGFWKGDVLIKSKFKKGDVVLFQKYTERTVKIADKDYYFIKMKKVLGTIKNYK